MNSSPDLTLYLLIAGVSFLGIVVQSVLGFGVSLITMPLLIQILDPVTATTYVALLTMPLQLVIVWHYRQALHIRPFWRVIVSSIIGAPLGVLLIAVLDRRFVLGALGIFLIAYALYSLRRLHLPEIRRPAWGYAFGFISGALSGAYNAAGPPLVVYGTSLGWEPEQFKANLQALFIIDSVMVISSHLIAGHVDTFVFENALVALPVILIGSAVGFWLSRRVNEAAFRTGVLVLLLVVGVRLLLP